MKLALLLLLVGVVSARLTLREFFKNNWRDFQEAAESLEEEEENDDDGQIWAVLVAGSNGWWNYRHQADVAHAYQTLLHHGIAADNIITLMYDDIANNKANPYPGKLYNQPHGKDVYKGVKIDYKGKDTTVANFIAVLKGNASAVSGGSRRVLGSGPNDRVFIYFTDHGADGLISFPEEIMTTKQVNDVLKWMHSNQKFSQLVFYLEACESGSIFESVLPANIKIYAITAANSHESSWGTFCDNDMRLPCLGDLFSVNWIIDSDNEDLNTETLEKQFEIVKEETNKSHVQHFGDLSIANEPVAYFQGKKPQRRLYGDSRGEKKGLSWPSRDIELNGLTLQLESTNDATESRRIQLRINKIRENRRYLKALMEKLVAALIHDPVNRKHMFTKKQGIKDIECHHRVVHAFNRACVNIAQNSDVTKYIYVLSNLCTELRNPERIVNTLIDECLIENDE